MHQVTTRRCAPCLGARLVLLLLAAVSLSAADKTWDGGGGNDNWTTGANWDGDVAPVAGDNLIFAGTTRLTPNNDFPADTIFGAITFTNTAGAFVISGNRLDFSGTITNDDADLQTLTLPIIGWFSTAGSSGAITLSGAIGSSTLLTKNGSHTLTISGSSDNVAMSLTANAGLVILAKSSSAAVHAIGGGTLTINSGATVQLGGTGGDQIYYSGSVVVNTGGVFDLNGLNEGFNGLSGAGSVTNAGGGTAQMTVGSDDASTTFSGVISNSSGTLALTKSGTGTLILSGANTYSGTTTVSAGMLTTSNSAALGSTAAGTTVSSGATLNLNGTSLGNEPVTIAGTGVGGLGALVNNGATQTSALNNLTLSADATIGGTNRWDMRGVATVFNGGAFTLTKVGSIQCSLVDTTVTVGNVVVNGGIFSIEGVATLGAGGTLTLADGTALGLYNNNTGISRAITANGNARITTLSDAGGGNSTISSAITINGTLTCEVYANSTLTLSGTLSGAGGLTKTQSSTLSVTGSNTYSGTTTVDLGILRVTNANALGSTAGGTTVNSGDGTTAGGQLWIDSAAALTIAEPLAIFGEGNGGYNGSLRIIQGDHTWSGAITVLGGSSTSTRITVDDASESGSSSLSITGGISGATSGYLNLNANDAYSVITVNSAITMPAAAWVAVHGGGGRTIFNVGGHTFAALPIQASGRVVLGGDNVLPATVDVFLGNNGTGPSGTLDLNGFNQTIDQLSSCTISGVVNVSGTRLVTNSAAATTSTLTVGNNNGTALFDGVIENGSGTVALTKVGSGTLDLRGTNTHTGGTVITAGTLSYSADTALNGTGAIQLNGGKLFHGGISSLPNTIAVTASSAIESDDGDDLTLTSDTISATAGTVLSLLNTSGANIHTVGFSGSGFTFAGGIDMDAYSRPSFTNTSGTQIFSGVISGLGNGTGMDGAVRRNAAGGTTVLSGANTYAGQTQVVLGTLRLGVAGAIPDASAVSVAGSLDLDGFSETIGSLAGAGTVTLGAATLTTGGNNTSTTFSGAISGSGSLIKAGTGAWTLSGANTFTGSVAINAGYINVGNSAGLGNGGTVTVANAANARVDLSVNGITVANPLVINGGSASGLGALNFSGTGTSTWSGPITINANTLAGGHVAASSTGTLVVSGAITSSVRVVFRAGNISLPNAPGHTFSSCAITAATVTLGADNVLPVGSTLDLGMSGASILELAGFNQTLTGLTKNTNAATVTSSSGTPTLTLNISGANTYAGVLSGSLALTKTGTGICTLSGANTNTGATTVSAGTLSVTGSTAAGSAVAVASGGTLAGTGTVGGTVTIANGGTLSPGVPGLAASFVASNLRGVTQNDWRTTQTITGTRSDATIDLAGDAFGTSVQRASYGIGGSDSNWDNFSVQWDGWLQVFTAGTTLSTRSDDGSRVWIDRNGNGELDSGEWGSNGWGNGQGATTRTVHANLPIGVYRMRVQYEDATGNNAMHLLWNDAANSAGIVDTSYHVVPASALSGSLIGTLTTGAVTMNGSSVYAVDLNGTTPTFDQVSTAGSVACAGTLTIGEIINAALGKVYTIVNAGSVSGTFSGLPDGTLFAQRGRAFQIAYTATTVTLTEVAHPTTRVWDGGGADNNWTTAANWDYDIAPKAGDDLVFAGATRLTPNNDYPAETTFASITFQSGAGAFVIGPTVSSTGVVSREVWTGIAGSDVASIPVGTAANLTDTLSSLAAPVDWADSYGTQIRGFITAPTTGDYTFWIVSDNRSELWLSTDHLPGNKVRIARVDDWTGTSEWNKYVTQKSSPIALVAGQKYYVEVLHKEDGGGDHVSVGWAKPAEATVTPSEIVPGTYLSPYLGNYGIALTGAITNNSTNIQTVNLGLYLAATRTVDCASGNVVLGGVITGAGGVTKSGANALTLGGANAFAGNVALNVGTLNLNHATALGNGAGTLVITGGTTLDNTAGAAIAMTANNPQTWNGDFTFTGSNALDLGRGAVAMGAASRQVTVSASTLTVGGAIGGTGGLTKQGAGTLRLSGASTYAGATEVVAGTLALGAQTLSGFGTNGSGWTLNGGSAVASDVLTLTTNGGNQARSAFRNSRVPVGGFTASFRYQASGDRAADGTVFVLHNDPRGASALSGSGGAMAYGGGGAPITSSAAIAINIYSANVRGTGYFTGGVMAPPFTATSPVNPASGNLIEVTLRYDGVGSLRQTVTDLTTSDTWSTTHTVGDLTATVGGTMAYVGFTAATGGQVSTQEISAFSFSAGGSNLLPTTTALSIAAGATLDIGGKSQQVASLANHGGGGGSVTNNGLVDAVLTVSGAASTTFGGVIADGSRTTALTKEGSSVLTLSGTNTFTGTTTVGAGTLLVTGATASGSAVSVSSGATMGGSGTVAGAVTLAAGATLAPGTGGTTINTLSTGAVTMNATSTYSIDLNGTGPTADRITSTGAVACAGTLTIASIANAAYGQTYTIVSGSSVTGTFSGLPNNTIFSQQSRTFVIRYSATAVTLTDLDPAYTWVWDGGGADDNWTTAANWVGDIAPGIGVELHFAGSTRLTPNNDFAADASFADITFDSGAGAFVLGGNRITLTGAITNNDDSVQTLNHALIMSATRTVDAASGNVVIGGVLSGAGGLTKAGTGTLTLTGTNTYTGTTTISAGTLSIGDGVTDGSIASSAGITNNAALVYNLTGARTYANVISGTGTLTKTGAGTLTLIATNTFTGVTTISAGTLSIGNGVTNGSIATSAGIVTNAALVFNPVAGNNYGNVISGTGTLTKNGTGPLTLSGAAANTYSGVTTVNAGQLTLNKTAGVDAIAGDLVIAGGQVVFGANHQIANTSAVTMSGASSVFNGTAANTGQLVSVAETIASLTISGGVFNTAATSTWTITGALSVTGGASTCFLGNSGTRLSCGSLSLTGMGAVAGGTPGTADSFTLYGNSTTRQSWLTVGSGGLTLNGSILNLRRGDAADKFGSKLVLTGDLTTAGTSASAITEDPAGGTHGGFALELGNVAAAATRIATVISGADLTIGMPIANGSATPGAFTKAGTGTLTFNGSLANTYSGATTITDGTLVLQKTAGVNAIAGNLSLGNADGSDVLRLGADNQIADTAVITFQSGGGGHSAKFELNGYVETVAGIQSNAGQASVIQNVEGGSPAGPAAPPVLTVNNSTDVVYDGLIRTMNGHTVALSKSGTGVLTLRNGFDPPGNNYTGPTTVSAGRLVIDDLGAFTSAVTNTSAAADALTFTQTNRALTCPVVISGSGALTKNGPAALTLSGINTYTGATTVSAGTLQVTGATASGSAVTVASGATLGGTGTVAGTITMANGGTLAPGIGGTSIGTLTNGALTFNATSVYTVDLDGSGPTADRTSAAGAVALAGTLTVASITNAAYLRTYTVVSGSSISGTFSGLPNHTLFTQQGRTFLITYNATTVTLTDLDPAYVWVWDGGGADDNWTTAANWVGDVEPGLGAAVQFAGTTRLTPNNDFPADSGFASITFNSGAGAFVIGGNRIALGGNVTNNDDSVQTLNTALSMAATRTMEAASGNLVLGGVLSGAGGLTKTGNGTVILSTAANTYAGGTTISAGTLQVGTGTVGSENAAALGTGTVTIPTAGTLFFNPGSTTTAYNFANSFSLTGGTIIAGDGNQHLATGGATFDVGAAGGSLQVTWIGKDIHFDGVVTGSGPLAISPYGNTGSESGVWFNNAGNTYSGTVTVTSAATTNVSLLINQPTALQYANIVLASGGGIPRVWIANNDVTTTIAGLSGNAGVVQGGWTTGSFTLRVNAAADATYGGILTDGTGGALALTKAGVGVLTLAGVNTYTGPTTVSAGTLLVTGATASGSAAAVSSGATLGGNGTVAGAVVVANGGTLAPGTGGTSIATLSTGAVTLNASSVFPVDLDGTTPTSDQLSSSAAFTCSGTLTIASLGNPALGKVYTIVSAASVSGTFSGLANNSVFIHAGRLLRITYTATTVTLTDVAPVISTRQTLDTDGDGQIDRIRLTFDQNLNDDTSGLTVAVTGYTVSGFAVGTANDQVIDVLLTESGSPDTGATPAVRVTANSSLRDVGDITLVQVEGSTTAATDAAVPVLLSTAWSDGGTGGVSASDTLTLTFSESVTTTGMVVADLGLPVSGDTLSSTTIADQSGATISMTLSGTPQLTPGQTYSSLALTVGKPSGVFIADGSAITDVVALSPVNGDAAGARDLGSNDLLAIAWESGTNPKAWVLGTVALGHTANTASAGLDLALRNVGASTANLAIDVSDSAPSGWSPAAAAGSDVFLLKVDNASLPAGDPTDPSAYELTLSNTGQSLIANLLSGVATDLELFIGLPTAITSGGGIQQTTTVTITATLPP